MVTLISQCCDSASVGEITDGLGVCGHCYNFVTFDDNYDDEGWDGEDTQTVGTQMDDTEYLQRAISQPVTIPTEITDKQRLSYVGPQCDIGESIYSQFDPRTISWITPRIAVTSREGVSQALSDGHFVINTAEEINNKAHVKLAVKIHTGTVLHNLIQIANVMDEVLKNSDQKIVVHCAMGMERSVLGVIWYLATKQGMTLNRALELAQEKRPIAQDRLNWIKL